MTVAARLDDIIRNIPDFPKPGIQFKDISTLFLDVELCKDVVKALGELVAPSRPDAIAGIESRGFLLGPALAMELQLPFIMVRKAGKLPAETLAETYQLEYGEATIEVHRDAIKPGMRICIHDDVLATGGTVQAAYRLLSKAGGMPVSASFLLELGFLHGRQGLSNFPMACHSLVTY
jgi:adenine phosphoribosyltransferase